MTAVAIIVSAKTDMLALCRAALHRFAPKVRVCVVATHRGAHYISAVADAVWLPLPDATHGAVDHPRGIHYARSKGVSRGADIVILLDDDTVVLSDLWFPMICAAFAENPNLGILGGMRSRGLIGQAYIDGRLIVHAHMMAMRADVFEQVGTFYQQHEPNEAYVRLDTGAVACLETARQGYVLGPVPFHEPGRGPLYGGLGIDATEYFSEADPSHTLWAHLGRGTSFAPQGWWRERVRRITAGLGSARSQKILRRQAQRTRFLERSWAILTKETL